MAILDLGCGWGRSPRCFPVGAPRVVVARYTWKCCGGCSEPAGKSGLLTFSLASHLAAPKGSASLFLAEKLPKARRVQSDQ